MRAVGHYMPSRVPGFPVYETVVRFLQPLGPLATNALSAIAGWIAVALFWDLARRQGLRAAGWLALALAMSRGVWVESTQTMDYALGLAFVMGSLAALTRGRWALAGALLAMASGCRASASLLLLPEFLYATLRGARWRDRLVLVAAFVVLALLVFLPVLRSALSSSLQSEARLAVARVTGRARALEIGAIFLFGHVGLVVLVAGLLAGAGRRGAGASHSTQDPREDRAMLALALSGIAVVLAMDALIPLEPAYLIPALPFALLLAGRRLAPRWAAALAIVMAIEVVVQPVNRFRALVAGPLFEERATRREWLARERELEALAPGQRTVYLVGRPAALQLLVMDPRLEVTPAGWAPFREPPGVALWREGRKVGFAAYLDDSQRVSLGARGYRVVEMRPRP